MMTTPSPCLRMPTFFSRLLGRRQIPVRSTLRNSAAQSGLRLETLEARLFLTGVVISEFQASNNSTIADEDGDFSDWIELYNSSPDPVDITGWHLTDDASRLSKWTLGDVDRPITLQAGEFKLIFASGKDRTDPASELHTDFRLSADGEFLALVEGDGMTIASQYAPKYPTQLEDHSYGLTNGRDTTLLVDTGASVSAFVPTDDSLGLDWTQIGFNVVGWTSGTTAVGYERLATGFTMRDEFTDSLDAEWIVDIPAEGSGTVNVADGNLRMDVPDGQDSTADRGLAPIVYRDPPPQNSSYDFITKVTYVSGNGAAALVVYDAASGQQVLSMQANRQSSFLSQMQSYVFDDLLGTAVRFNLNSVFLRISRDLSTDTWTTYFRTSDAEPWTEVATVTEGVGDVPQIVSPRIGVMTRTSTSAFVADFDFFELQVADAQAIYGPQTGLDVESDMFNANSTVFTRIPFTLSGDPVQFDELDMPIRYDDGFIAYLNGVEVARRNAPGVASWDAAAIASHGFVNGEILVEIVNLDTAVGLLREGENVLALQGLNTAADDVDFFILPQLAAINASGEPKPGYFSSPTPGELNPAEATTLGPFIEGVTHTPNEPSAIDTVVVTAAVVGSGIPLGDISLTYRVMYDGESAVQMVDDGTGQDVMAGDGVYTGTIPAGVASPGQMVRYYISSQDTLGNAMRSPRVTDIEGTDQSPEYYGTVIQDPSLISELPVFQWFTDNVSGSQNRTGARASVFYKGEFYDNVFVRERGGFTNNGSQKFNFNDTVHPFFANEKLGRMAQINLNAQGSDPSFIRQPLAFQSYEAAGNQSSDSFLMLMHRNGSFDRVGVFIEQVDEYYLERHGLDPKGALYKFVQRSNLNPAFNDTTTGIEKKTRLDEDMSDLQAVVDGLNLPTAEERMTFVLDNFNVPQLINYVATRAVIRDIDDVRKNFYLYRDTEGTGEWYIFPWDKDWTFGAGGGASAHFGSPFFGAFERGYEDPDQWSVLYTTIFDDPPTREMYLRRLRTVMDKLLQPPSTPADELWFEQRVDELFAPASSHLGGGPASQIANVKAFFPSRRNDFYFTHSIDNLITSEPTDIIPEFVDDARYFVPSNNDLGMAWTGLAEPANIADWGTGQAGFGYEDTPGDYQSLIRTTVRPSDTCAVCTSVYLRVPFEIDDVNSIRDLTLRMKYDDGFIAYINGTEVARSPFLGSPSFDMTSLFGIQHSAVDFQDIIISQHIGLLNQGANILAIQSFNSSATDSDQLISPVLVNGTFIERDVAGIPHEQIGNPQINFGDIDYDPVSENQDEEYIQLTNPNETAVDLTGWRLVGGVEHTFHSGTVIPAGGSLYVSPDINVFRARAIGPSGGQALLVQGNYQGHISNFGETIELLGADGMLVGSVTTPSVPTDAQLYLRLSEIHYNPADGDDIEFIELLNISNGASATTLDLSGVTITDGPSEPFVIPDGFMLSPGAYLLVAKDPTKLQTAYPQVDPGMVIGPFSGRLANGGERIKVNDVNGSTIVDFTYSDSDPWPERADGAGASLEMSDPSATPREEIDKHYRWRGSSDYGGSPGGTSAEPIGIVINEVLANTDPPAAQSDSIELFNTTNESINIGGWFLSDAGSDLRKFQIPANTILGPEEYIVFDENDFNPSMGTDPELHPQDFALNGASGDDVYLVIPDGSGGIATFVDDVHFGASPNGESFGRVSNGRRLAPMSTVTLGDANGAPRVGPLIITELNYNPGVPSSAALAAHASVTAEDLEFIEVHNPTDAVVSLTDWRIRGGVDFEFDASSTIGAGETMVIISFNPDSVLNGDRLVAFRAHYGLDESFRLLGGYDGQLNDNGERVQLQRPDGTPPGEPALIPRLSEDEVLYDNLSPWANSAAGEGDSLQRRGTKTYGNFANSWLAAAPSPGTVEFESDTRGDLTGDGVVDAADINALFAAINTGNAPAEFDLDGSSVVDSLDVRFLVQDILGTFLGDANLDGRVNATDLNRIAVNWRSNASGWEQGDFNGDGTINAIDLNILGINWLNGEAVAEAGNSPQRRIPRAPLATKVDIAPIVFDMALADELDQQLGSRFATLERLTPEIGVIDSHLEENAIAEPFAKRRAHRFQLSGTSPAAELAYDRNAGSVAEVEFEIVDELLASLDPLRGELS